MAWAYSIREGVAGFQRAKFAFVASISATAVALVLIGVFGLLMVKAQQVTSWMKQRVGEIEVFLDDVDEATARATDARIALYPGVAVTEYISKAEAQDVFRQEFGEGAELFLDDSFLPASIKVRVDSDYANPDSLQSLVEEFSAWNRVDEVVFNQPLLLKVQQNLRLFTLAGLILGAIVIAAALFLVGNTIRLTIYARRLLIRTMKLVGATDPFIQQPFIVEGVMQGGIAGVAASVLIWLAYSGLSNYLPQLEGSDTLLLILLSFGLVALGILLGWLASFFAVQRFIKQVALH